eukprot:748604-Hanusia_phi.AAC.4
MQALSSQGRLAGLDQQVECASSPSEIINLTAKNSGRQARKLTSDEEEENETRRRRRSMIRGGGGGE